MPARNIVLIATILITGVTAHLVLTPLAYRQFSAATFLPGAKLRGYALVGLLGALIVATAVSAMTVLGGRAIGAKSVGPALGIAAILVAFDVWQSRVLSRPIRRSVPRTKA